MLNKNTIDAYHKITAPEGLQERIEARVREEQEKRKQKAPRRKQMWIPTVTVLAAAAVCLAVAAGNFARVQEPAQNPQEMRLRNSGVQLVLDGGEMLDEQETELNVLGSQVVYMAAEMRMEETDACTEQEMAILRSMLGRPELAGYSAMVIHVVAGEPVRFTADSDCLSMYDTDGLYWKDCADELVFETEGDMCVLLPEMKAGEVLYIEMSSSADQCRIVIVYDEAEGRYYGSLSEK